jgi:hypothetical protein
MSMDLEVLLTRAVALSEVLAHAQALLSGLPGTPSLTPLVVEGTSLPLTDVVIGPFVSALHQETKEELTIWELGTWISRYLPSPMSRSRSDTGSPMKSSGEIQTT